MNAVLELLLWFVVLLNRCGLKNDPTFSQIRKVIASVDADGTGTIEFSDFLSIMTEKIVSRMDGPVAVAAPSAVLGDGLLQFLGATPTCSM